MTSGFDKDVLIQIVRSNTCKPVAGTSRVGEPSIGFYPSNLRLDFRLVHLHIPYLLAIRKLLSYVQELS